MAIDSRTDKVRELVPDEPVDGLHALIEAAAAFVPVAAIAAVLKDMANSSEREARFRIAVCAICDELDAIGAKLPRDASDALKEPWFRKAVQVVIEEALSATDREHARMLAIATAHGCFPDEQNKHRREDLASYIRDLAQLGTDDIQMLKLLYDAYKEPLKKAPNINNPNFFTPHIKTFQEKANKLNIHPDDCVALGLRLSGFGLAYEEAGIGRLETGNGCFRPTLRGLYLLSLLEAAERALDCNRSHTSEPASNP